MKKGQAAMEFFLEYGWAILVILIAIGALAYFGVLSPERFQTKENSNDAQAEKLCSSLENYPEYQEKVDAINEGLTEGTIYIPMSVNLEEQPRVAKTTITLEDNTTKIRNNWMGEEGNMTTVFCIIPSEICYYIGSSTTKCVTGQDRMQFDYQRWRQWHG